MRDPLSRVRLAGLVVAVFAAACVPPGEPTDSRLAERATRPVDPPTPAPRIQGDESMAALTAEVRQLRLAIEELARSQAETQALGMTLSAQQGRIQQIQQQLDAVRGGLAASDMMTQGFDGRLTGLRDELSRTTAPSERDALEDQIRVFEADQAQRSVELQQLRSREGELARALALEERRWNETLTRMEQLSQ
jgi:hypothetical protein